MTRFKRFKDNFRRLKARVSPVLGALMVVFYFYLITWGPGCPEDDVVIGMSVYLNAIIIVRLLCAIYDINIDFYLYFIFRSIILFGNIRVIICCISLATLAYGAVFLADDLTMLSYKTFGHEVVRRLEDSIVHVKEERNVSAEIVPHPLTGGHKEPFYLKKLFRYPMEDVHMSCSSFKLIWFTGKPLKEDHVEWRLNGVPVKMTDRHTVHIEVSEFPSVHWPYREHIRNYGVSMYEVRATLTIQLLSETDFGSYTCHIKNTRAPILDYITYMDILHRTKAEKRQAASKPDKPRADDKPKRPREPFCQCQQAPVPRYMPQETVVCNEEYRVIPARAKQQRLSLPPASILSFTTDYHVSARQDEVEVEYLINDIDFFVVCPDGLRGCSMILLYYWMHGYELGDPTSPPFRRWLFLQDFQAWKQECEHVNCLCENSYGIHSVRYMRRYFNRTTERYELIEVPHLHTLDIIPREQNMFDFNYVNRSTVDAKYAEEESSPESRGYFESVYVNIRLRTQLAVAVVQLFRWTEVCVLLGGLVLLALAFVSVCDLLKWLGGWIMNCTLRGSLAYYVTAVFSEHNAPRENGMNYDVFVSSSDAECDAHIARDVVTPFLEDRGLRVCYPERDFPAGSEVGSLDRCVQSSGRFLIFLSSHYTEDRFRHDFEIGTIVECVVARPAEPRQILIVRLDDSTDVPFSLRHLPVYSWTGNLSTEDHLLAILRQLQPVQRAHSFRCTMDAIVTMLPLGLTLSAMTVYKIYSFFN